MLSPRPSRSLSVFRREKQAGRGGGHVRSKPSRVLLYDKQPGGTGISSQVRPIFGNLLEAARDLIKGCETR